jgi:sortase A
MKNDKSISDILKNLDNEVKVDTELKKAETEAAELKPTEDNPLPERSVKESAQKPKKPKSKIKKIIDFALIGVAVVSLAVAGFAAWNIIDTKQKESVALNTAEQNAKNKTFSSGPFSFGDIVGLITISEPEVNIKTAMVFGGQSGNANELNEAMKRGAAIDSKSPMIGEQKQSVIYGHRNQEFLKLKDIKEGHKVKVETAAGVFNFVVKSTKIVQKNETDGIDLYDYNGDTSKMPTYEKEKMILYTCYPFNLAADTNQRFLVYTELDSKE